MSEELENPGVESAPADPAPVLVPAAETAIAKPETKAEASTPSEEMLKRMLSCGVHFGHQKRRWNPKMAPYIFGIRNQIHIIDLIQTASKLQEAKKIVHDLVAKGGVILFVCTKKQGQEKAAEVATKCHMPYINKRWIGGLFTNFKIVSKRIKYLNDLRTRRDSGELDNMIKKERVVLLKELEKLENLMGGISTLTKLPDLVFIIDPHREGTAVKESLAVKIPIMASLDTNCDPDVINYPIPANDDAIRSINFLLTEMGDEIAKARLEYEAKMGITVKPKIIYAPKAKSAETETKVEAIEELEELEKLEEEKEIHRARRLHQVVEQEEEEIEKELKSKKAKADQKEDQDTTIPTDPPASEQPESSQTEQQPLTEEMLPNLRASLVKKILDAYKTVESLKAATLDEISELPGVGPVTANRIKEAIDEIK